MLSRAAATDRRRIPVSAIPALVLAVFALLSLMPPVVEGKPVLVDEVAASVNGSAITRSQVIQETRFIIAEKGQNWMGRLPAELLNTVLERLIGKELIYQELRRVSESLDEIEIPDDEKLLADFRSRFTSEEGWRRFMFVLNMTDDGLLALLRRNARIEAFMERRLNLLARVSDEDVQRLLNKRLNGEASEAQTPAYLRELEASIRNELRNRNYKAALEKWLSDLQARNRVLTLISFKADEQPIPISDIRRHEVRDGTDE